MQKTARSVAMAFGLFGLTMLASTAALPAVADAQRAYPGSLRGACPCMAEPFFGSFFDGQRDLVACTNNLPFDNFVRLVSANIDLVVLFAFSSQLFCGWQPVGDYTLYMPITPAEFDMCKRSIVKAASAQGLRCQREP